ncbi:Meiotic nuclear division protein 1 [Galdieria sulphuraria]|uniref:Meiotic nuclear division protein 1 homolog n=1 Tax=Galdieria sulphuraria TaxID=130081 RepID=M2VUF0_GALSU|nr:uncharacterized protein Gasu_56010 [Galdieria sulphuraria]EME26811.1 hypothetical protein Gasu_56010 [Galdieria sulphuraria]GJD11292.1 Meiotic nuclear division protein 1 [Galdieria sulphuraria]|eukprot:XP_005703331.1 hypothetical protein Gasu_56010 [Galdieria sulphuraria]
MSKKKGLSFDDKRTRMLEIFTESKTFFTLKELEKVAPKQKGIVLPSVKEVLQSLVDDDVVSSDKCGTQTVYWCLPSQAVQKKRCRIASLTEHLQAKYALRQQLFQRRDELRNSHQDTEERTHFIEQINELESKLKLIQEQLDIYKESDPEVLAEIRNVSHIAWEATNRWTDNIFSIRSWVTSKFGLPSSEFDKNFGLSEDFDYI